MFEKIIKNKIWGIAFLLLIIACKKEEKRTKLMEMLKLIPAEMKIVEGTETSYYKIEEFYFIDYEPIETLFKDVYDESLAFVRKAGISTELPEEIFILKIEGNNSKIEKNLQRQGFKLLKKYKGAKVWFSPGEYEDAYCAIVDDKFIFVERYPQVIYKCIDLIKGKGKSAADIPRIREEITELLNDVPVSPIIVNLEKNEKIAYWMEEKGKVKFKQIYEYNTVSEPSMVVRIWEKIKEKEDKLGAIDSITNGIVANLRKHGYTFSAIYDTIHTIISILWPLERLLEKGATIISLTQDGKFLSMIGEIEVTEFKKLLFYRF